MPELRKYFLATNPIDFRAGQLYKGDKEICFFTFTPVSLLHHRLKIAIVYNFPQNRFEVWLAARNKEIQKKYWDLFQGSDWNKYHIPENSTDGFAITDHVLLLNPEFSDYSKIMQQIEVEAMKFTDDMIALFED